MQQSIFRTKPIYSTDNYTLLQIKGKKNSLKNSNQHLIELNYIHTEMDKHTHTHTQIVFT